MAVNERDIRDPRLERLYREAAREGPPAHLDAAILAAARREVDARPRALSSTLRRWQVPVSIAAVVVVSATLVILVKEEEGDRIGDVRIPPIAAPADRRAAEPLQTPPAAAVTESSPFRSETPAPAGHRQLPEEARRQMPAAKSTPPLPTDTGTAAMSGVAAGTVPAPAAEPLPKPLLAERPRISQEGAATPPPAESATAGKLEGGSPGRLDQQVAPAADVPAARAMARASAAKPIDKDRPPVWHGLEKEPPEKWLARIEELMREGRAADAEEVRSEFKRRFPGHPLGPAPN